MVYLINVAFVHASNIPVLDFENKPEETQIKMREIIYNLLKEYSIGSIALGCAGMAHLANPFSKEFGMPVIDGVSCSSFVRRGDACNAEWVMDIFH